MKKVFLLIALVATVFASNACGKKDDTKPQEQPKNSLEQKLIGKWKITDIGLDADGKVVETIERECQFVEYLANHTGNMIAYGNSDCKNHPDEKEKNTKPFSWRLDGMKLYVTFENTPEGFSPIESISNNTIIFKNIPRDSRDLRFNSKVVKIGAILERLK